MSKTNFAFLVALAGLWLQPALHGNAFAAEVISVEPVVDGANEATPEPLSPAQLEDLAAPVALYPDDLLAIVLPAATYPLDVVKAARFLEAHEKDSSLAPDDAWDESVIALLNYPEVVYKLDEDLDWTWALGEAVLFQEEELIAAIERFRDRAYEAGNLRSDDHQVVEIDDGAVSIVPVQKEIIYVPYYEPRRVVVRSHVPVYHYYPRPYPVYYYPYPANYVFASDFFWGVSTAFHISFHSRHLRLHHYSYASHPYFGRRYFPAYYRHHRFHYSVPAYRNAYRASHRSSYRVTANNRSYSGDKWRASYRTGVRPRVYNDYNYPRRQSAGGRANRNPVNSAPDQRRRSAQQASHSTNRSANASRRPEQNALASGTARRDLSRDRSRASASTATTTRSNTTTRTSTLRSATTSRSANSGSDARRQTLQRNAASSTASREDEQRQVRSRTSQRRETTADRNVRQERTVTRTATARDTARRYPQQQTAERAQSSRRAEPAAAGRSARNDDQRESRQRATERSKAPKQQRAASKSRSDKRRDDNRRSTRAR